MTASATTQDCCSPDSNKFICTRISAAFLLVVSAASWVCMMVSVIPAFAQVLAGQGAKFSLAVRFGIALSSFNGLPVLALVGIVLVAGFCLKNKRLSAGILMGAAIVVTTLAETLILWSVHDILPYLK
jgi:type II secretory pathway component PulF